MFLMLKDEQISVFDVYCGQLVPVIACQSMLGKKKDNKDRNTSVLLKPWVSEEVYERQKDRAMTGLECTLKVHRMP